MKGNVVTEEIICITKFGSIHICKATPYSCAEIPSIQYDTNGDPQKIVTASTQLKLLENGQETVFSPSLYQNCMEPEKIEIFPLVLEFLSKQTLRISTRYTSRTVPICASAMKTTDWQAAFHPSDCIHCTNCGRCGW